MQIIVRFLEEQSIYFPLILFGFLVTRYLVISGGMYLILWKLLPKKLENRRIQGGELNKDQINTEVKHSIISFLAMSIVSSPLFYLFLKGKTAIYFDWGLYPYYWIPLSIFISFLWHDIYFYWSHRWLHQPWNFRRIHYIHHLSRIPTPFASHSFHWFEGVLQILFIYPVVLFIPMHALTFIIFMAISHFFAVWGHFNFELMPFRVWDAWWGSWVTTSTHHNDHHNYHNKNFGLYLKVWDQKFSTLNDKTSLRFEKYNQKID